MNNFFILTQLKKISSKIDNKISLLATARCKTCFYSIKHININFEQLQDLYFKKKRLYVKNISFNVFCVIVLLHEIAHYKQYRKYINKDIKDYYFEQRDEKELKKTEDIADRYALMYYKKVLQEQSEYKVIKVKLTNKDVECYLVDVLGYDDMSIDDIKENFKPLKSCLNNEELQDCINYNN